MPAFVLEYLDAENAAPFVCVKDGRSYRAERAGLTIAPITRRVIDQLDRNSRNVRVVPLRDGGFNVILNNV